MALAPAGWADAPEEMLRTTPWRGRCRICGETSDLETKEHIPPRVAGNSGQYRGFSFQDWLDRGTADDLQLSGGRPRQGGTWAYVLCAECNNTTGVRYAREYLGWAARASNLIAQLPSPTQRDEMVEDLGVSFRFGRVHPGAFVRQVLSCMCSIAGGWNLTERYPVVREIILDRSIRPMPEGVQLSMAFCWGPRARYSGPLLVVDTTTGEWKWVMELAFPPLAFSMVLASSEPVTLTGVDLTSLTTIDAFQKSDYEVEEPGVLVGFTWSQYWMDYRSRAAMRRDRATEVS